jgi:hypothetical protein
MSRKRIRMSKNGVTLTEATLFGGTPRVRIGVSYIVRSPRQPDGRKFETLDAAKRYFSVQASLQGGLKPRASDEASPRGKPREGKIAP